ncbi:hypothetical protein HEP87_51300 [Streptomyces sp. S1D4-11]|nr:hypothetical protein [Streptomyces sp. S1D4-11]QIZ00624.1 hypothetical protein HEP87_51300 [Streptomyces sp. S1D4-11]
MADLVGEACPLTAWAVRACCTRHLKWRDLDEGRAVPVPPTIAAKVQEHVRLYGAFRVEEGLNRLEGDYLFAHIGRTNRSGRMERAFPDVMGASSCAAA